MSDQKKQPLVYWVHPGVGNVPMSVIDGPPQTWQDPISGSRVKDAHMHEFVKVVDCLKVKKFLLGLKSDIGENIGSSFSVTDFHWYGGVIDGFLADIGEGK